MIRLTTAFQIAEAGAANDRSSGELRGEGSKTHRKRAQFCTIPVCFISSWALQNSANIANSSGWEATLGEYDTRATADFAAFTVIPMTWDSFYNGAFVLMYCYG